MLPAVLCTLLCGMATAQNFYLQHGLAPPYMPPSMIPYVSAESSPKPSFFRKPFFSSGGSSGGSRPPGKGFFRLRAPSFLSGLRGSASSPRPSFFSFGRPSQQQHHQPQPVFQQHIPLPSPLHAAAAHATYQALPMPGGPRFTFSPEAMQAMVQQVPTHISQATEFAESQVDTDRTPGGFSGVSLFQPQASESFGSSVGDQDSFQQQVNSVVQLSPSSSGGYGYKTEGSSVYNGIMTAQLGVPVSLTNYGESPLAIPVGATRGQQSEGSGSDSQSYTPSAELFSQSQSSSGQKAQSSSADQQYSSFVASYPSQQSSGSYGQSSSSGTRYSSAPSSDPTVAFFAPQTGSGYSNSPATYALSSGAGYVSSSPSAYLSGITSGYETSIANHGSDGSNKYGPAYSIVSTGNYPTSSSGSYGSQQPSSYSSQSGSYSPSSYGSSGSRYTMPTRTYSSSQPSSGYSSTAYSSGSPSKYTSSGSGYSSSSYGSSTSGGTPGSSVAYDNSQSTYASYGQRYPSSTYSTSSSSGYSPKRPATNYASTSTSYKNSQAASAALAQALKAYAAGNAKYVPTKTSSPSTDSSYSTSYSSASGSSSYGDKGAAAPYFRAKTPSSSYSDGSSSGSSKTSSKASYDQRTVGQTLRVSADSGSASDSYASPTRTTSSTPSKSSSV